MTLRSGVCIFHTHFTNSNTVWMLTFELENWDLMVCGSAVLGRMSLPDWYLRLFRDKLVTEATICKYQFHSFSDICKRMLKMLTYEYMYESWNGYGGACKSYVHITWRDWNKKTVENLSDFLTQWRIIFVMHFVASAYIVHQSKSELPVMVGE
jgi:hypothetical protein